MRFKVGHYPGERRAPSGPSPLGTSPPPAAHRRPACPTRSHWRAGGCGPACVLRLFALGVDLAAQPANDIAGGARRGA